MNDRIVQPAAKDGVASGSTTMPAHSGGPRQGGHSYTIESEIHLLDRIAVLYRYRIIAITVFILTTLGVMIQGYTTVQVYRAQARLLIEDERSTAIPGVTTAENTYYEDPERWDLHRPPKPHLAFGTGHHQCLGMHLGRLELRVALEAIVGRLPNLRLDPAFPPPEILGLPFRSPPALHVLFG